MKKRAVSKTRMVNATDESKGAVSLKGRFIAEATESFMGWKVGSEELIVECKAVVVSVFACSNSLLVCTIENFILLIQQ